MLQLLIALLNRAGFIILFAYILVHLESYKLLLQNFSPKKQSFILILVFTLFTIISNVTGVVVDPDFQLSSVTTFSIPANSVLANTRAITITTAGLLGGPVVGFFVGLLSGIFRMAQGGYVAYTYLISSVLIGLVAGFYPVVRNTAVFLLPRHELLFLSVFVECIQMTCIAVFSHSLPLANHFISFIMAPMVLVSTLGIFTFISIIKSALMLEKGSRMLQTHHMINLSKQTIPLLQDGYSETSTQKAAKLIADTFDLPLVLFTDLQTILSDRQEQPEVQHEAIKTLMARLANENYLQGTFGELGLHGYSWAKNYRFTVVPIVVNKEALGSLILCHKKNQTIATMEKDVAQNLGELLSLHIELALTKIKSALLKDAEIKALQAQVNPHFFFNALNSISSLSRTNPEAARHLLLQLSNYFRANLMGADQQFIPLSAEIQHIEAYLSIVMARFPNRYKIHWSIEEACLSTLIPPFCLQMLVENAVNYAFEGLTPPYDIEISAQCQNQNLQLTVADEGIGISEKLLQNLWDDNYESHQGTGTAIRNIKKRVTHLYGSRGSFTIDTKPGFTKFNILIPMKQKEV